MAMTAIDHLSGVDPRTALILQRRGVFREDPQLDIEDPGRDLLLGGRRVVAPPGPLVFLRETTGRGVGVVDLTERVLDADLELRRRAFDHLVDISSVEEELLCPGTAALLSSRRSAVLSSSADTWQPAALDIYDAVRDDWLCNLAQVRQSIATRHEEGYRIHILKVLRPSVASLSALPVPPRLSHPDIRKSIIDELLKEKDILSLLDGYYARLGYVPLNGECSLSVILERWLTCNDGRCDWDLLWDWAKAIDSPTPRYHVCQTLIEKPELVPPDKRGELWGEVVQVVVGMSAGDHEGTLRESWLLRCELARHFSQYILETGAGGDGELCALQGWWLAEKVGVLPGTDGREVQKFRESTVREELTLSSIVREIGHPIASPSSLLYETLFARSIWSRSLEACLGSSSPELMKHFAESQERGSITAALVRSVLMGSESERAVYGFDRSIVPATEKWIAALEADNEEYNVISACLTAQKELTTILGTDRALTQLGKGNEADDLLVASHIRRAAYFGTLDTASLWAKFNESTWREKVFLKLSPDSLVLLLDAFCQLQVVDEVWRTGFPHLCALAAEQCSDGSERSQLLFAMTVCACTCSGTVSAIRRLLTGKVAAAYVGDAQHWHNQLAAVAGAFPGAVAAQIRPIVGELLYAR